jgi:hypothetical protein
VKQIIWILVFHRQVVLQAGDFSPLP